MVHRENIPNLIIIYIHITLLHHNRLIMYREIAHLSAVGINCW